VGAKVDQEHLHNGSALNAVDAKGRLSVPAFIRSMIERRSPEKVLILGKHETDPALVGYDANYKAKVLEDVRRLRLRDEEQGGDPRAHYGRSRVAFALTESAPYDTSGRIILPPLMRKVAQIEDLVLFLGTGETFELWNPHVALKSGDPTLEMLATYHLEARSAGK